MLPLALLLFLIFITPVRAGALIRADQTGTRAKIGVMAWGVRRQWEIAGTPGAVGRILDARKKHPGGKGLLKGLFPARGGGLRRAVRLQRAEICAEIGLRDAAAAALLCSGLTAVGGMIPGLRLSVRPRLDGRWALRGLCIAESRLGILCVALILALRAGKKEEKPWIIPSAA